MTPGSGAVRRDGGSRRLADIQGQEDWEGGANDGAVRRTSPHSQAGHPHPTAPAFIEAARQMGFPVIDDVNGPMRAGAGYINMNIAADGTA